MCFSATASFTTALVLIPTGIYCVKKSAGLEKPYWLFALIPSMFGLQQFFEGFVWLGLNSDAAAETRMAALGYLFFSHLFWLLWIPLSCYAVEDNATKRKFYFFLTLLGAAHGLSLYVPLLLNADWVKVTLVGHSIKYKLVLLHDETVSIKIMNLVYATFTLIPLLTASDRYLKIFGGIIVFSLATTSFFFNYAFISVWCFFSAVLSGYILHMILQMTNTQQSTDIAISDA